MKWMLIIVVFGMSPVKTNLVLDSLQECVKAEDATLSAYADSFNLWNAWAQANPSESGYPNSRDALMERLGLHNRVTCIPHAQISN